MSALRRRDRRVSQGDQALLRPAGQAFLHRGDARLAACFPPGAVLQPDADGRFRFGGRTYQLAKNFPPEPHAIHGHGWQNPWMVADASASGAELTFRHAVSGTPFDYRARQIFTLHEDGVEIGLEVTNAGDRPTPTGIGLHPYFTRSDGVRLRARLDHVWRPDERKIPQRRVPLPRAWDFARGLPLAPLDLDHCFGGWDGRAELHWPETDLTLVIEAEPVFGHVVIYVPPGQDFFCIEPVSHVNDGFNLLDRGVDGTGVRVLAPGETLDAAVRFRVV